MKERPIIFNAESVKAILDGSKSVTRRIIKPQPLEWGNGMLSWKGHGSPNRAEIISDIVNSARYKVGDRVWVRETFTTTQFNMLCRANKITLEITEVRVERIQDISGDDAAREGVCYASGSYEMEWFTPSDRDRRRIIDFSTLWDSLNAKKGYGWEVNPWVFVIEFKKQNVALATLASMPVCLGGDNE